MFEPRTAVVTIYPGDYLDRIRHLERLAEAAQDAADADLPRIASEVPEYLKLAQEHDELVREAEEKATHIRVQHLPRKVWKALVAAHPPRTEDTEGVTEAQVAADVRDGVNVDSFREALVYGGTVTIAGREVDYASIIEPEDITSEALDKLSDIDFDRIYLTAFALNRVPAADPKASLVSRLTPKNDETSS